MERDKHIDSELERGICPAVHRAEGGGLSLFDGEGGQNDGNGTLVDDPDGD